MFEIDLYLEAVLTAYYQKRDGNELVELQRATRGRLMKEFLQRLENGQLDSELYDLKNIFGCTGDRDDLRKEIKKAGADKFRPLQDFIRQKTSSPADSVIKLLAIFIDFEPRPFEKWVEIWRAEKEKIKEEEAKSDVTNSDTPSGGDVTNTSHGELGEGTSKSDGGNTAEPNKGNGTITVGGDLKDGQDSHSEEKDKVGSEISIIEDFSKEEETTTSGSSAREEIPEPKPADGSIKYFFKKNKHVLRFSAAASIIAAIFLTLYSLAPEDCMCWNGEEYVVVNCQDKTQPNQVIGLDKDKLAFFRKITRPDTLGLKDIGRVWYSKIDNEVEFFTNAGKHPVHHGRSLKAATRHMLETRAGKNAQLLVEDSSKSIGTSLE